MWFDVGMGRQGVRSQWSDMPRRVRDGIDKIAGSAVIDATNLEGGFSPGPAARCGLADGRTVFVKAAGVNPNPFSPAMHRQEGQHLAALGPKNSTPGWPPLNTICTTPTPCWAWPQP